MDKENLKSSVIEQGKRVTEIIVFSKGNKKTFKGILTESINQGEFTRFDLIDGRRVYVNPKNVDCFEVISEDTEEKSTKTK
ncbi:MAG: hypothetical protein WC494_02255 [Candidatus Pacearchaeota archaeon]